MYTRFYRYIFLLIRFFSPHKSEDTGKRFWQLTCLQDTDMFTFCVSKANIPYWHKNNACVITFTLHFYDLTSISGGGGESQMSDSGTPLHSIFRTKDNGI